MKIARFDGKICVVTGGTQGVGRATAGYMAEQGAAGIVICGRQTAAGEQAAKELTEAGTPTEFVTADLEKVADCFAVVDAAERRFGRVDVLVNVAGITERGTIETSTPELYDRVMAINTRAPFFLMQRAVPLMRKAGGGAIVNVVSITSHGGAPYIAAYSASKSALAGLTRNTANALRKDRIRVNGINMGWTATPAEGVTQQKYHGRTENWREEIGAELPFGRMFEPEEVARAIVFLASEESAVATGSLLDFEQFVVGATD